MIEYDLRFCHGIICLSPQMFSETYFSVLFCSNMRMLVTGLPLRKWMCGGQRGTHTHDNVPSNALTVQHGIAVHYSIVCGCNNVRNLIHSTKKKKTVVQTTVEFKGTNTGCWVKVFIIIENTCFVTCQIKASSSPDNQNELSFNFLFEWQGVFTLQSLISCDWLICPICVIFSHNRCCDGGY